GEGAQHAPALAAAGADRVLLAEGAGLVPYTTDAHAAVLAEAIRTRAPRLVLVASTARGRDLAPRVAARLGLGLTGDAIDLDLDAEGRVRQMKPAFGGTIVAPILSRTRPEMATVRPGILRPARPDPTRRAVVERIGVPAVRLRVRVLSERPLGDAGGAALEAADLVLGVGRGIGGPAALPAITALAARLGAALGPSGPAPAARSGVGSAHGFGVLEGRGGGVPAPAPGSGVGNLTCLWGPGAGRRGGEGRPDARSCGGRARFPPRRRRRGGR